jgi:hypothetical protein
MKIEVTKTKENEDGSADFKLDLDEEAIEFLVRYGLVKAIEEAVNKAEKEYTPDEQSESGVGNTEC